MELLFLPCKKQLRSDFQVVLRQIMTHQNDQTFALNFLKRKGPQRKMNKPNALLIQTKSWKLKMKK